LVKSFIRGGADDPKVQRWIIVMQSFMPGIVEPYINELEWMNMDEEEKAMFEDYYVNGARVKPA
jgi:hypothetical protein